jgi:hypothetical protein
MKDLESVKSAASIMSWSSLSFSSISHSSACFNKKVRVQTCEYFWQQQATPLHRFIYKYKLENTNGKSTKGGEQPTENS